uniref:Uncharacterized protein n=1 Tax=Panagrolaimus davidi TaxID=227884 RepID=A0A914QIP2_9BILA
MEKSRPHYYAIVMITIFQLVGAAFSFLAMEKLAGLKAIGAGAVAILVISNAFYLMISKSVKHKIVFDKNAMVFLMIDFGVQSVKVLLYSASPKKATISDAIKMFGCAAGPLVSLIIPLLWSKVCDIILKRIPCWLPMLTKGVLNVSGYEEVKFNGKCVIFSVNKEYNALEKPDFEIFCHKKGEVCVLRFLKDGKEVVIKCDGIQNILVAESTVHLCAGEPSTLDITFETKDEAERCKLYLGRAFQSQLQTVSNCFCFNV